MSLLLEALKKAEKAKEEAQRRAREEKGQSEPAAPPAPAERPVLTRDKLPEIGATSLEIVNDDISPPGAAEPRAQAPLEPPPALKGSTRAVPDADEDEAANRASARKVFEAKFREPNPRMPFYITLGVLGLFSVGTVAYFWYQLRPPAATLVVANPPAATESASATPPGSVALAAAAPGTANAIPGLPHVAAVAAPRAVSAPGDAASGAAVNAAPQPPRKSAELRGGSRPETPRLIPRLEPRVDPVTAPPSSPAPQEAFTRARPAPEVQPHVAAGYQAYIGGDLTRAQEEYELALREEPANRDALLGLAALNVRAGRLEAAEGLYLRLLQADPRNAQAQAALIGLRAGRSDPLATESRVKSMLAADPGAHALSFTLGNQLAQQNRWAEAQQEYFKAHVADPENADFAYNLAVSLDHLRQPRQALEYYQRAIGLAEKHGAGFDLAVARGRAAQLAR